VLEKAFVVASLERRMDVRLELVLEAEPRSAMAMELSWVLVKKGFQLAVVGQHLSQGRPLRVGPLERQKGFRLELVLVAEPRPEMALELLQVWDMLFEVRKGFQLAAVGQHLFQVLEMAFVVASPERQMDFQLELVLVA